MALNSFAPTRAQSVSPLYRTQKQPTLNCYGVLTALERKQAYALAQMRDSAPAVVEYLKPYADKNKLHPEELKVLKRAQQTIAFWAKARSNQPAEKVAIH